MDDALAADLASTALAAARRFHAGATLWCVAPRWEPRHLVYPGDGDLPRIAVAVVDVHTTVHERSPVPRLLAAARALRRRATGKVRR